MKKVILVVEDNESEQKKAKEAISNEEYRIVIADNYRNFQELFSSLNDLLAGVITDMHFPEGIEKKQVPFETAIENSLKGIETTQQLHPVGLAVVTQMIIAKMPVVICSNIDGHSGHENGYLKNVIWDLEKITGKEIPLVLKESNRENEKDWDKAFEELKKTIKGERE